MKKFFKTKSDLFKMKLKLLIIFEFLICLPHFSNEQVISFSMRKIAYSTNQFGLDLLRASNKNDDSKLVFCPFCISSSLVMLLMGSQGEMSNALRHALYLYGLSENEINFAYFDMMNHLGVNLPTQKQSTNNLNFKTPANAGSGASNAYPNNLDLLNKANLLSSESQTLTLIPNNYLPTDTFGQRNDASGNSFKTSFDQLFQPYEFADRNKILHPFSPFNENQHRNNFIKFSTNTFDRFPAPVNSDLNTDIKTSNYLFGRFMDSGKRTGRAFGFKTGFWNSKSYLNPFGTMLNAFQNNFQTQYPSNYQNSLQSGDMVEKFGQNINHQALNNINNIKLPNNFHYYNKHLSSKPNQDQQRNQTTTSNQIITNRKQTSPTTISSTSTSTTESPRSHYSTPSFNPTSLNHHHNFNHHHHMKDHFPNLDNTIVNPHSIRLGNTNVDLLNQHNTPDLTGGNDISFLSNIYVQRDFVINYHYHVLLQKFYKTAIHPLDFIHNGEETRQHINAIVQMQTDNKICDILPERQSPSTQLLLVSALYFKGELDLQLNLTKGKSSFIGDQNRLTNSNYQIVVGNSSNGIHHHQHNATNKEQLSARNQEINDDVTDVHNQSEEIWMEASRTRLRFAFDKYLNCSTIEMPFKDSMITLVIMMPTDINGLNTLLTKLNAQMLNDVINSLEIRRITIKLPRINIENSFRNLSMALANLGLSDLFRPGHSQLTNISDFRWLYVSDIIHKTHLNIKESSVNNQQIISSKQRGKQDDQTDVINIELNKPFLFFIMDNVSGLIMSMGIDKTKSEK